MEQEKKYLKTIEEVSDALTAGKVVFCDAIKTRYYKDKNNLIIGESEEFGDYVGDFVEMQYSPYILEPKPLEVKLWHLYEDKKGDRVLIGGKYINDVPYPFYGIVKNGSGFIFYNKNGKSYELNYDLVKEIADLSKYFEKEPKDEKI